MFIEGGADVSAQNKKGETPLHLASQGGHAEVVGMLKTASHAYVVCFQ
jgi:ankyrin repeat protein